MVQLSAVFSLFSIGASRRISEESTKFLEILPNVIIPTKSIQFEMSNNGDLVNRSTRDSIGQNRLLNNLFSLRKGQSRSNSEFDLMSSIASRVTRGSLTRDQRKILNQIMKAAKAKRSAQKYPIYARPVIDFRRGFF